MKKGILYIWAFVFILSTGGVLVDMHYCMGKVIGTSIGISLSSNDNHCTTCGMKKKSSNSKGCCHDTKKLIKNNFDQKTAEQISSIASTSFEFLQTPTSAAYSYVDYHNVVLNFNVHAPPPPTAHPIYLRHRSFLI